MGKTCGIVGLFIKFGAGVGGKEEPDERGEERSVSSEHEDLMLATSVSVTGGKPALTHSLTHSSFLTHSLTHTLCPSVYID